MKSVVSASIHLAVALAALSIHERASAACTGHPIVSGDAECEVRYDRLSCEAAPGCNWVAAEPVVRVCNRTNVKISIGVQYVRNGYNKISEEGWWNLDTGACQDFEATNSSGFSYIAKQFDRNFFWAGNGDPVCYDASGQRYQRNRAATDLTCGTFKEVRAYQTFTVQPDGFIKSDVTGAGQSTPQPAPAPGNLSAVAAAVSFSTGNYAFRSAPTLDQAKANAMEACAANHSDCQLATWVNNERPACIAMLRGAGSFRAWAWSYDGETGAINAALQSCQGSNQSCTVDHTTCNNQ